MFADSATLTGLTRRIGRVPLLACPAVSLRIQHGPAIQIRQAPGVGSRLSDLNSCEFSYGVAVDLIAGCHLHAQLTDASDHGVQSVAAVGAEMLVESQ